MSGGKTCSTCRNYRMFDSGHRRFMVCEGLPLDNMYVNVLDDSGLEISFRPPSTFSCSGWELLPTATEAQT